jgi:adenylate cyclase
MTFLKELMRRNVLRIGMAYLVVAWILIQIVNNVAAPLNLPHWTPTFMIVLLGVGFPIALIIAWAFELTPQGVKRTDALMTPPPRSIPAEEALRPAAISTVPSLAVLPFVNMSPDKDQEYFSDGLTEELLNKLARLSGLQVTGRTSSFHYKGRNEDIRTIGENLSVANVLEGSVRKSGNKLRITAQLIEARNGYHLWTETYDREIDDIFAIQDEIAEGVARALAVTLGVGDLGRVEGMTHNVEAYEAYLRGASIYTGKLTRDWLRSNIDALERAVRIDPSFAIAWARLALQYNWFARYDSAVSAAEWLRKAAQALAHAVELAPDSAEVLSQLARAAIARRDWAEAARIYRRALDLHGDGSLAFAYGDFLLVTGKARKALDHLIEARRLEPLDVGISVLLAVAYDHVGQSKDALAECDRGDSIGGEETHSRGVALMVALGMRDRAEIERRLLKLIESDQISGFLHERVRPLLDDPSAALAELHRLNADPAFASYQDWVVVASWAAYFGDQALVLTAWNQMCAQYDLTGLGLVIWMQLFRDMRRLPGFNESLRELGLVDYWRTTDDWGDFCHPVGDDDFECS